MRNFATYEVKRDAEIVKSLEALMVKYPEIFREFEMWEILGFMKAEYADALDRVDLAIENKE